MTLEELKSDLDAWWTPAPAPPAWCAPTGDPYMSFGVSAFRPLPPARGALDIRVALSSSRDDVVAELRRQVLAAMGDRKGRLYWRILPEYRERPIMEDGVQIGVGMTAYCRLIVSDKPVSRAGFEDESWDEFFTQHYPDVPPPDRSSPP